MVHKSATRSSQQLASKSPPASISLPIQTAEQSRVRRTDLLRAALMLAVTLVAYWPALRGGLIWDDAAHVTRSELRSAAGFARIWLDLGATQQYYPLLHSAFWIEHHIWGDAVLGYHLTNVILHYAAALLVVCAVRRLAVPGAWLAGFIFALHPVCVNSVAWISEQKSTLSAVFYLASLLVYLKFDRSRRPLQYALALLLFVLALMSKTVTATLPAALLVIFWWQRGRLDSKRDVLPLVPWLGLGAAAGLFTAWVERRYIGAEGPDFALPILNRCLLAGRIFWFYLAKLVWPRNLAFIYPHWDVDTSIWRQYLFPLALLALAAAVCSAARRRRWPLAAFLFFAGTLFPVLGFLNVYPFIYSYVADHFQYLAGLGVIVPAASGIALAVRRLPARLRSLAPVLSILLLAVLGALTWSQAAIYRDPETIYRDTLKRNPGSWMAQNNLGAELLDEPGKENEAITHLDAALRLKPDSAEAHNNRGKALEQIPGRRAEAINEYRSALRSRPRFPEAENNLGRALSEAGRPSEALPHFESALRMRPKYADAETNFGVALMKIPGHVSEATTQFEAALAINPALEQAHNGLGSALSEQPGNNEAAIREFEAAIRIRPDYAEAHLNLGQALSQFPDKLPDGVHQFEEALRIRTDYAVAHNGLGVALAKMGRTTDAITHYQDALRLQPDYAEAHNNLGTALAQMPGRLPEAIPHLQAALRANPQSAEMHANLGNALSQMPGRLEESIHHFEEAVGLRPDFAEAHYLLGLSLARSPGKTKDALEHLEVAQRLRPDLQVQPLIDRLRRSAH
ncbi:MAG TPA: tetratricopeptide repeat protein [Bryobacteraceae bacterium]|nr:tetratricopeptide repeat protein [Bryobacteraceae bacterium]